MEQDDKKLLCRAQGRMGKMWLSLQSTWMSQDMGALQPVLSKSCKAIVWSHSDTKVCIIPFSQNSKL